MTKISIIANGYDSSNNNNSSSKTATCSNENFNNSKQSTYKPTYKSTAPWYACCHYRKDTKLTNVSSRAVAIDNLHKQTATNNNNKLTTDYANTNNDIDNNDNVLVSDIIGGFGLYQLLVLIFSGLREGTVGYDAVITSIITQPENKFRCIDMGANIEHEIFNATNLIDTIPQTATTQCFQQDSGLLLKDPGGNPMVCESFSFHSKNPQSLVITWNLICQREYLVALIECTYFIGLVIGNIIWGCLADTIGRWRAYIIGHIAAIVFGLASVFAPSVELFIIFRFFTAIGSISYNIIYTIQVEIIGTKYRSYSTVLNHLGWGTGVLLVPLAGHCLPNYRSILAVSPCLTLLMLPWAFSIPESSRWLMANGYYQKAKEELLCAAKFNRRKYDSTIENKIASLNDKINHERQMQELRTNKTSYRLLFTSWSLVRDTIVLSCCTFLSHLFYYNLTINYSYFGSVSMDANFIISGLGEFIGCIIGALMMKFIPQRRLCIFIFFNALAVSFVMQSFVDTNWIPSLNNRIVTTTINAIGTISSLTSIFIILIVNQEIYPTIIRQTGSSLVNTLGETGSAAAPFLVQVTQALGAANTAALFAFICIMAALSMFCLKETGGSELLDTVNQEEMMDSNRRKLSSFGAGQNRGTPTTIMKNRPSMTIVQLENIYWTQASNNMANNGLNLKEPDVRRRMSEDINLARTYNSTD